MWSFMAGAGIPLIGVFNSGITRSVGNPFAAAAMMFAVALLLAAAVTLPVYGAPTLAQIWRVPLFNYASGLIVCFYALSATVIIPRFGAASFVAFILIAQLVTSALVDQFGWFGMPQRPVDALRFAGLAIIAAGILVMEISNLRRAST
jgi:transporter family-2 protein